MKYLLLVLMSLNFASVAFAEIGGDEQLVSDAQEPGHCAGEGTCPNHEGQAYCLSVHCGWIGKGDGSTGFCTDMFGETTCFEHTDKAECKSLYPKCGWQEIRN